ncbi:Uncharacterised protein [Klebsiella quasipneumoniae]|uniref:hypothetical protein n=1 Tax=Klebsiella quasipneumoniae TaxID=1463165 RepID=UPI00108440DC|nr:hypothetical protein [Klebsiella quasipneumoniae]VGD85446.1 Uncharacterised protein [Klebsiella quasipneumoniae]VGE05649.1 Uncharacterised protein [Klebsiella quasipneumoniae]VGE05710.1 Uncharacterised protein [Klebsiella quasipneumoniae]VGE09557.1 Uncharacterised protein [Klebsiella quasipneumoniae]VGE14974.1 Uncharacterised protein [Klebsiella quasipneumoniae]
MSRTVPFEVLMHAENALSVSEGAYEILSMWLDSIPNGVEFHSEACRVCAIMTLLHKSIDELLKAQEAYSAKS